MIRSLFLLLLAGSSAAIAQTDAAPGSVTVVSRTAVNSPSGPRLEPPFEPVWTRDERGFPLVSEAGFVQVKPRGGPGFYTSYELKHDDQGKPIARIGGADSGSPDALWGDIEAIAAIDRIVRRRYVDHPRGLRLGIGDISSRYAGYPDLNKDGVSDHRTHQGGCNINFLVPCKKQPEIHIHLGREHGEHFDPVEMRHLINLCIEEGTTDVTTNIETRGEPEGHDDLPPLAGKWRFHSVAKRTKTRIWKNEVGCTLYFLVVKAGHGSHLNCFFGRME